MDVQEGSRLQLQAFEAINEVVRSASSDTLPLVGQLIQALLDKLASTFRMQIASIEAREHQNDLQVCSELWFVMVCTHEDGQLQQVLLRNSHCSSNQTEFYSTRTMPQQLCHLCSCTVVTHRRVLTDNLGGFSQAALLSWPLARHSWLFSSAFGFAVQGLLCGVLQVVIQKLSDNDSAKTGLLEKADSIMQALLGVFQCHAGSVHEEAMLAVGALTYACGQSFTKYMQSFYPVLKLGLENHRVRLFKLMSFAYL